MINHPYCQRCGIPHGGQCLRPEPKTLPEKLDAAESGEEFAQVLNGFFNALDKARWADDDN